MTEFKIVICSHQRPDRLLNETLSLLEKNNINPNIVNIYIHEDEIGIYKNSLKKTKWEKCLIQHNKIGLKEIRTFVSYQYKDGEKIVFMDDDIRNIIRFEDKKKYNKNDSNLIDLITIGFDACKKHNASLWGCCPYDNPFFGNQKISTNLKYIIQACCGVIINHEAEIRSYTTIEDFERTIKYFLKDGKVIRVNYYGLDTKFYGTGGLDSYRNFKNKEIDIKDLCKKYPNMVSIKYRKKKGKYITNHPKGVDVQFNYRFNLTSCGAC